MFSMKTIKPKMGRPPNINPQPRHAPASLRMDPEFHKAVTAAATASGHSLNSFVVAALEGIIEMINTPDDAPVLEPRIVAIARFIRRHKPGAVVARK